MRVVNSQSNPHSTGSNEVPLFFHCLLNDVRWKCCGQIQAEYSNAVTPHFLQRFSLHMQFEVCLGCIRKEHNHGTQSAASDVQVCALVRLGHLIILRQSVIDLAPRQFFEHSLFTCCVFCLQYSETLLSVRSWNLAQAWNTIGVISPNANLLNNFKIGHEIATLFRGYVKSSATRESAGKYSTHRSPMLFNLWQKVKHCMSCLNTA